MLTLDNITLNSFMEENRDFIEGAQIQKIQQPTRRDFVLALRNKGEGRKLYINIDPRFFHVCFMRKENEMRRLIEIPAKPPMFCMLLRKYIENARIVRVSQPPEERILELYTETYNEFGEKIHLCLAIELMGKHSNVILYNYDTNVIIGAAHNIGPEKSKEREIAGGLPYVYPPKRVTAVSFRPLIDEFSADNVNEMIDDYFSSQIAQEKFDRLKAWLLTISGQKFKKDLAALKKMECQLAKEENADKYRLWGDLIFSNPELVSGASAGRPCDIPQIALYDYENSKDTTIVIDETLSFKENAQKFYKLYNKAKTSSAKLNELLEVCRAEIIYSEQILYSIEAASGIEELIEIKAEICPPAAQKKQTPKTMPQQTEVFGLKVFVGRNNRQNDYIVSKLAKDEDWWFHTKTCAGSHVLLKCDNPSDEVIIACAKLAKEHSRAAASLKAGVIYTKAKHVKKPPGANLGYVIYKEEKEIIV
jgi:predicted ribosome quality control (RQC) complex YloA/Tae2 family protein